MTFKFEKPIDPIEALQAIAVNKEYIDKADTACLKDKKNSKTVADIFLTELLPLGIKLKEKLTAYNELFFYHFSYISFYNQNAAEGTVAENAPIAYLDSTAYEDIFAKLENINKLTMHFSFSEYRDAANGFDVLLNFAVDFESYYYQITTGKQILMANTYDEKLSPEDRNEVIENLVKNFTQIFSSKQAA